MSLLIEDFCTRLSHLRDAGAVWDSVASLSRQMGFASCSLTMAEASDDGPRSSLLRTDLPSEFQALYLSKGMIAHDPFLSHGCTDLTAKRVGDPGRIDRSQVPPEHMAFLECAMDHGATCGIGLPVRQRSRAHWGGWVFSTGYSGRRAEMLFDRYGEVLQLVGHLAYERMAGLKDGQPMPRRRLSGRERDCLQLLAQGLRAAMIADRLSVSISAVNLYIANAKRKLKAGTREQAIARAVFRGDIAP